MYDIGDYVIHKESGEELKIIHKSKNIIPFHYTLEYPDKKTIYVSVDEIKKKEE